MSLGSLAFLFFWTLSLGLLGAGAQEPAPAVDEPAPAEVSAPTPGDEKPADEKPADEKPADEKPADEKPADEKPADEKPAESADEKPEQPSAEPSAEEPATPRVPAGELPWKKPSPRLPGAMKPIDNALQLLELRGIAKSEWERFRDGEPWGADDQELLLKLLLQYRRIDLGQIAQWRLKPQDWWKLTPEEAAQARGSIFEMAGTVRRVEVQELIPELVEIYEFKRYYRLLWYPAAAANDAEIRPVSIFVRRIPTAWLVDTDVAYPASIDALFLRAGGTDAEASPAYFVGDRVAWHPQESIPSAKIHPHQVLLSAHGFDAGLLADLNESDGHPFEDIDREPFYQTLFALSQLKREDWKAAAPKPLEVPAILSAPFDHRLELVEVRGNARRIVKVLAEQDDLLRRFGIVEYYEVDFFLPLGDQAVKLGADTKDHKAPIYYHEFPATLCVLHLPPGVKEGDNLRVTLKADAAFYRVWSYRSDYVKQFNPKARQIAPMFLANTFELAADGPELTVSTGDMVIGGVVFATLVGFGAFLYFASKKPKSLEPAEKLGKIG